MAQSAITVTPPNPTPPTNYSCTGATPPNVPNFTKVNYAEPFGAKDANGYFTDETPPGVRSNPNPPPYFDDGTAGSTTVFAANTAALASGTGATSGGTENTYPGTGTGISRTGAVPASTSVAAEGAGTEVVVTQTYGPNVFIPAGPLVTVSCLGSFTGVANPPNQQHASSLSPVTAAALTTIAPTTSVHGTAAITMTATGTNFTRQSAIVINGVPQATTFVSATSLTCLATPPAAAGSVPVIVRSGGAVDTAAQTWTIS